MMETSEMQRTAESEIKALVDQWLQAVRNKDVKQIMVHYAPDCIMYDAIPPLQYKGKEGYQKNWEKCFDMMPGPLNFEMQDMHIVAHHDLAFCHSLSHMQGTTKNSEQMNFWLRATVCYRKIHDKWLVVHEHISAPFDPETGKALIDLTP